MAFPVSGARAGPTMPAGLFEKVTRIRSSRTEWHITKRVNCTLRSNPEFLNLSPWPLKSLPWRPPRSSQEAKLGADVFGSLSNQSRMYNV